MLRWDAVCSNLLPSAAARRCRIASMSSVGLPPGLDLSEEAIVRNKNQRFEGLKRASCWAAMADIPEDRLIDAGTLLGYMRVVENDQNPFVVASAYILAASTAEETGLTEVLPRLRDGVVWKLLQYSGETKHNFRHIVKFSFGDAWSLTLHSQLMKAAWDARIGHELGWTRQRRGSKFWYEDEASRRLRNL